MELRPFRFFLALVIAAPATAAAQLPRARPETVGMSSVRLARIRPMLRRYVEQGSVAGLVALVARDGRLVELDTAGWRDVASHSPMRRNTIFRIASMTKAVTSVAAMMLVEEGRLRLADSVSKYIPEFASTKVWAGRDSLVPPERAMTIHDLLTHRSGLVYGFIDTSAVGKAYRAAHVSDGLSDLVPTQAENMTRLAAQPLAFQPGHEWRYSLSVDVLGRVVEIASGLTLDEFLHARIFQPLRMHDTGFRVPDEKLGRLARAYSSPHDSLRAMAGTDSWEDGRLPLGRFGGPGTRGSDTFFSGGAGLFSTAGDYARFAQMLLNGGQLDGARLLSPKTVELMTADATSDLKNPLGPGVGFGLGFAVVRDLGATGVLGSAGTYSWGGILGTSFWIDPKERLVGVLMMQLFPNRDDVNEVFQTLTYQSVIR
ncbi:MAG TPA: serine hydrolase domain-containing protein [Gemmatimonadales bacterium]|jgi:CubicO group peptidase (beta-lactamase class C family)|nr:serine hydrolase domain-containing protein [Gemmatimonadales bacterium]